MFRKSFFIIIFGMLLVTSAGAETHLYLYRGSAPSEAQIKAWQVAVAGYSPDGVILVTNDVLGQRLQSSHPQVIDLGVWEEGTARFIIPTKDLTATIKPLYRATGWALVEDAVALQRERIHGVALQHGRPFIPKEQPAPVPQTKPNRYLPGLGAILNGITSGELMGRVNNLVNYQTRYSPSTQGHQAAEDMADAFAGWGYDVTRWRYISTDLTDIFIDGDSIWICGTAIGFSPLGCVFHSNDGGLTFSEIDLPSEYRSRKNNRIVAEGDNVILTQYGSILVSHDAGQTWVNTAPVSGIEYKGIYYGGNNAWCASVNGQIFYSTDSGDSWQGINFNGGYGCNDIVVSVGGNLVVGGLFGIYVSTDGGQTWSHNYQSPGRSVLRLRAHNYGVVGVGSDGLVVSSAELTQFQTVILGDKSFYCINIHNDMGLICGEAGVVYVSQNFGSNWQQVELGTESTLYSCRTNLQGFWIICGTSGTIRISDNDLNNWQDIVDRFDPTGAAVWTDVIAQKQGATRPGEIVMATAHLDSITWGEGYDPWTLAPGADDNATGSSTVLTLANAMRNLATERTLRFILYTGEEEGLIGSSRYAFWSQAQGEDIQAVYNLDMTGYAAGAIKQDLIANQQSAWLSDYAASCAQQYVPGYTANSITDPLFVYSDHSPYWGLGVPALCSIESWEVRGDNPYYHTPQDVQEWLNTEQMLGACRVAGATIGELAQPGDSPLPSTLADLKVYPNPFRLAAGQQLVTFENVPVGSKVEIYDLAGNRVARLAYADGYRITWAGRNDAGSRLATGVYLYKVSASGGGIKTGKLAIIN
jgi:photosystem II stability/assembly factor-like uncharacterized protein